jgi:two-component system phosphate regulon sensor histidine kinase PhoR
MEEAVILLDFDLTVLEINEAALRLADTAYDDAVGKELLVIFRNTSLHNLAEKIRNKQKSVDQEIILFQDSDLFLQVHGSIISGTESNEDSRILIVLNDVTTIKKLEQIRKDFVANVSHELKTPITAAKGYVETLLGYESTDPATTKEFLSVIHRQVNRLASIVEDLLIISRLEQSNDIQPEMTPCNLQELLEYISRMYLAEAEGKNISLQAVCPPEITVTANRILLEQGIANLVDNAVKYSEPGESIEIEGEEQEGFTAIRVIDHGHGIADEHIDRIFERFYRVDKGRSRDRGGTGLGLSIVKHVALAHKGQVTVESTVGSGSTFTILLPRDVSSG